MEKNIKVVILCGGKGSRLAEETKITPKPMIKIGNLPILIHIMKKYYKHGFKNFVLALGYKKEIIIDYFKRTQFKEKWNVELVNTGKDTLTAKRLLKLKNKLLKNEIFLLTYGDGLSNLNINKLVNFHIKHNKVATVTAVRPPARFGELKIVKNKVLNFDEKNQINVGWINGGFFVFNKKIFNYLKDDETILEKEPLEKISKINELSAYKHNSFWHPMDTLREKLLLEKLCKSKTPLWLK